MGRVEGRNHDQQPRALATGQVADRRVRLGLRKAGRSQPVARVLLAKVRDQPHQLLHGREVGRHLVELVLREVTDP